MALILEFLQYLMRFHGLTLKEAYQLVQMKRKQICPNNGFFRQLIDYEKQLRGSATVQMISPSKGVECADVVWQELCAEFERTRKIPAPQLDVVKVDWLIDWLIECGRIEIDKRSFFPTLQAHCVTKRAWSLSVILFSIIVRILDSVFRLKLNLISA